jgi:hypothetical protein
MHSAFELPQLTFASARSPAMYTPPTLSPAGNVVPAPSNTENSRPTLSLSGPTKSAPFACNPMILPKRSFNPASLSLGSANAASKPRPKLSLNIAPAAVQATYGGTFTKKSATRALSLQIPPSCASPTTKNTYNNARSSVGGEPQSPATAAPKSPRYPSSPRSPRVPSSPLRRSSRHARSPHATHFSFPPYTQPHGLKSILRNSRLPTSRSNAHKEAKLKSIDEAITCTSPINTQFPTAFPKTPFIKPDRGVRYCDPLTEDVKTELFTWSHLDLLEECDREEEEEMRQISLRLAVSPAASQQQMSFQLEPPTPVSPQPSSQLPPSQPPTLIIKTNHQIPPSPIEPPASRFGFSHSQLTTPHPNVDPSTLTITTTTTPTPISTTPITRHPPPSPLNLPTTPLLPPSHSPRLAPQRSLETLKAQMEGLNTTGAGMQSPLERGHMKSRMNWACAVGTMEYRALREEMKDDDRMEDDEELHEGSEGSYSDGDESMSGTTSISAGSGESAGSEGLSEEGDVRARLGFSNRTGEALHFTWPTRS